jgi:DNA invertase Pin-like site-specific DNA recombinase
MKVGLYVRTSTWDQSVLSTQKQALEEYIIQRGWQSVMLVEEIGVETINDRPKRKLLYDAAQKGEIDVVVVWRLDCWARSVPDLINTITGLRDVGAGFISLTESFELTADMAKLLEVFVGFERDLLGSIKDPV